MHKRLCVEIFKSPRRDVPVGISWNLHLMEVERVPEQSECLQVDLHQVRISYLLSYIPLSYGFASKYDQIMYFSVSRSL